MRYYPHETFVRVFLDNTIQIMNAVYERTRCFVEDCGVFALDVLDFIRAVLVFHVKIWDVLLLYVVLRWMIHEIVQKPAILNYFILVINVIIESLWILREGITFVSSVLILFNQKRFWEFVNAEKSIVFFVFCAFSASVFILSYVFMFLGLLFG